MSKEIEIELTFLAAKLPDEVLKAEPIVIEDVYVPEDADEPHIRLRRKGEKYEFTRKYPIDKADVSEQVEETIRIDKAEFAALSRTSSKRVIKKRYSLQYDGTEYEIDVFDGPLTGLVLIDVEFETIEARNSYKKPDLCLVDVTQEKTIAGGQLAGKSYDDIKKWLDGFNYKRIGNI